MTKRQRIGIFASSLSDPFPRGVQRVARSIAENLVAHYSEEFHFLCLAKRICNQRDITYDSFELSEWLNNQPLRSKTVFNRSNFLILLLEIQERIKLILPPIIWSLIYSSIRQISIFSKYALSSIWNKKRILKIPFVVSLLGLKFIIKFPLPSFINTYTSKSNTISSPVKKFLKQVYKLLCPPLLIPLFKKNYINESLIDISQEVLGIKTQMITLNELDIVISFDPFDEIWDLHISEYKIKFIGWFHDAIPLRINEGINWNPDKFSSCVSKLAPKADKIICVSSSSKCDLNTFFPESAGKTLVIYNGHDLQRFNSVSSKDIHENILNKFSICIDTPYLISIGVIEQRKNIIGTLRACIQLKQKLPELNFQLVIVGEEGDMPNFGSLIKQARQYLPVIYTGYADDKEVVSLLSGAVAFVYPSLWEGFGIPPLEAMTAGTLVVTSDVSSLPEVCEKNALYCNPYEISSIADAISVCLNISTDEREKRIKEAQIYASHFTWEKTVTQVVNLLREISNV